MEFITSRKKRYMAFEFVINMAAKYGFDIILPDGRPVDIYNSETYIDLDLRVLLVETETSQTTLCVIHFPKSYRGMTVDIHASKVATDDIIEMGKELEEQFPQLGLITTFETIIITQP